MNQMNFSNDLCVPTVPTPQIYGVDGAPQHQLQREAELRSSPKHALMSQHSVITAIINIIYIYTAHQNQNVVIHVNKVRSR